MSADVKRGSLILVGGLLAAVFSYGAAPGSSLEGLEVGVDRLLLHLSREARYEPPRMLDSPPRLVIDLIDTEFSASSRRHEGRGSYLKTVRAGQFSGGERPVTRVVLELNRRTEYRISIDGGRLVVELGPARAAQALAERAPEDPRPMIEYRGLLRHSDGSPADGAHLLSFGIYPSSSSPALWRESSYVWVDGGRFTAVLGRLRPLPEGIHTLRPLRAWTPPGSGWEVGGAHSYLVQAGVFSEREAAVRLQNGLLAEASQSGISELAKQGHPLWMVWVGPFPSRLEAKRVARRLRDGGLQGRILPAEGLTTALSVGGGPPPDASHLERCEGLIVSMFDKNVRLTLRSNRDPQAGERLLYLSTGAAPVVVAPDSWIKTEGGEAAMLLDSLWVVSRPGVEFSFLCSGDSAEIMVHAGQLEVRPPEGAPQVLEAGEFIVAPPLEFPSPSRGKRSVFYSEPTRKGLPSGGLRWKLHPHVQVLRSYESNIYRAPPDRADGGRIGGGVLGSWITSSDVGIGTDVSLGPSSKMNLHYQLRSLDYAVQPRINNAFEQTAKAGYSFQPNRRLRLELSGDFADTKEQGSSELVGRQRRIMNSTSADVEALRGRRILLGAGVCHTTHRYKNQAVAGDLNRYEQELGLRIGLLLSPNTKTFLRYRRQRVRYRDGREDDSDSDIADVVLGGRLLAGMTGDVSVGAQRREYEAVAGASVRRQQSLVTGMRLAVGSRGGGKMILSLSRSFQEASTSRIRNYVATVAGVELSGQWRRLTAGGRFSLETDGFSGPGSEGSGDRRRDDIRICGVSLGYAVRPGWSLAASYIRARRKSNFPDLFDYVDEISSAGVRLQF